MYYAHTNACKPWQLLKDHLINVGELAKSFAKEFQMENMAFIIGLLHDLGKYSTEFQARLKGERQMVNHSLAGAIEAIKRFPEPFGLLFAYCITGHHGGLVDYGSNSDYLNDRTLSARLQRVVDEYSAFQSEIDTYIPKDLGKFNLRTSPQEQNFTIAFLIKMLYSCLVDADFLDTENYMNSKKTLRNFESFSVLEGKFIQYMKKFQKVEPNFINQKRQEIFRVCQERGKEDPGFFSLTVPTGGGKTLSSLAFALEHLKKHQKRRIIYVIPYTSIIEQNAKIFKNIFGEDSVLEHHYNYEFIRKDDDGEIYTEEKIKKASENWDIPIVVTTNVQFFESLFSNLPSRNRKLHNISNSVVIFDEAQMFPVHLMKPCLQAIKELVNNYRVTAVFSTATPPALDYPKLLGDSIQIKEIVHQPEELTTLFKRVQYHFLDKLEPEDLSLKIKNGKQVLCVVNTKKMAYHLFELLEQEGLENAYHLSTNMTPLDRQETIERIREHLKKGECCYVISTPLIEAGVDLDFITLYREICGIDSIIQAAGRCNREGKLKNHGDVFIFSFVNNYQIPNDIDQRIKVSELVFDKFQNNFDLLKGVKEYFKLLYRVKGGLDSSNILQCFEGRNRMQYDFETASEKFKIISKPMIPIIVSDNEICEKLVKQVRNGEYSFLLKRQLQRYSVGVFEHEFNKLLELGKIEKLDDNFNLLIDQSLYNKKSGLMIPDEMSTLII